MEIAKREAEAVESVACLDSECELVELTQFDLALVGGGTGVVSLG